MRGRGAVRDLGGRVAELRREVERQRYSGDDPVVALSPDLDPSEIVARTLAAERANALLTLDGASFNPGEDLADAALQQALGALRARSFAAVRVHLDEAARRAHAPATQQRIALFKALTRLLSALVYAPLDEKPRSDLADLDEALRGLDLLHDAELLHYRDEADRLLNLREAAARGDRFLDAVWTLLRAQLALGAGQDEAAILWLLRLAARHLPTPVAAAIAPSDTYLADLVARARARIAATIEPAPAQHDGGEAPISVAPAEPVRPRELSNALAARLSADLGRDLTQGMTLFTLTEYIAPEAAEHGPAGSEAKRRAARKTKSKG